MNPFLSHQHGCRCSVLIHFFKHKADKLIRNIGEQNFHHLTTNLTLYFEKFFTVFCQQFVSNKIFNVKIMQRKLQISVRML